jgi:hypothetical protein
MGSRAADKDKNRVRGPQEFTAPEQGAGKAKPTQDKKNT